MSLKVEEQCHHMSSKVRFNLALTCRQATANQPEPLWLAIESAPSGSASPKRTPPEASSMALEATLQKMGATGRSVRFNLPSSATATSGTIASSGNIPHSFGPHFDLCSIGKLCQYFHKQFRIQVAGEPCLGFLGRTATYRHFIFPGMPQLQLAPARAGSKRVSLKQILYEAAAERRQEDWVEKLRLAKLLSSAVLHFSNEWIPESWSSNDVCFYDSGEQARPATLDSPFINVPLSASKNNRITAWSNSPASLATNPTLFNLGVILIELGCDTPFENLSAKEGDRAEDQFASSQVKDFITARRLGESVHKRLNMTYGRLVKKCLNCNFGVATKLDDVELQRAVLVHVINELDICLKQWNDFNSLVSFPGHL